VIQVEDKNFFRSWSWKSTSCAASIELNTNTEPFDERLETRLIEFLGDGILLFDKSIPSSEHRPCHLKTQPSVQSILFFLAAYIGATPLEIVKKHH
jgi:hypothetical protein